MPDRPIIVIGASAGGVEALVEIVQRLPRHFSAAILIVVHFPASSVSYLPQILSRLDTLPAHHPIDQEAICPGQIYIAPPDSHLLIQPGKVRLSHGPRENGHRPAIDTLFRSAAHAYGKQVIGVILTGTLDDGTAGLLTIKTLGGQAIVQNPQEALFDGMPRSAIETVPVDWVINLEDIAQLLIKLVELPIEPLIAPPIASLIVPLTEPPQNSFSANADRLQNPPLQESPSQESVMLNPSDPSLHETKQVERSKAALERGEQPGNASPLTCPDCGGVLWELREDSLVRFRCHVGHAYSVDSLVEAQAQDVEKSLWSAVRALEEKAALARRMAVNAREHQRSRSAEQFEQQSIESHQHATVLRHLVSEQLKPKAAKNG